MKQERYYEICIPNLLYLNGSNDEVTNQLLILQVERLSPAEPIDLAKPYGLPARHMGLDQFFEWALIVSKHLVVWEYRWVK